MQILLKDIDPEIAARLFDNGQARAVLGISPRAASNSGASEQASPGFNAGRIAIALAGTILVYVTGLVMMGFAVQEKFPDWIISLFFIFVLAATPLGAVNWVRSGSVIGKRVNSRDGKHLRQTFLKRSLSPDELRALKNTGVFTAQHNQYLNALSALLELNRRGQIDDEKGSSLLQHLSGLLASERELETQVKYLESLLQADRVQKIQSEEKELMERLQEVRDPAARQDLEQSLEMCQARLESLRNMEPIVERVDAQRRVVRQTSASLEDSLNQMLLTTNHPVNSAAESLRLEDIQQSILEIQRDVYSTEKAVKEVMALRA